MIERPALVNASVVALSDWAADGIQFQFRFRDGLMAVALKINNGDSPTDVARALRGIADLVEGLNDESKWAPRVVKRRRRLANK